VLPRAGLTSPRLGSPEDPQQGTVFVVGLLIAGSVGAVLAAYVADRVLKARTQARRLRRMRDRLAAASRRAEEQQARREAAAQASAALTSVMPAIERPPLTLPGLPPRASARHSGPQDHRSGHPGASVSRSAAPGAPTRRSTGPHASPARSGLHGAAAHSGPHASPAHTGPHGVTAHGGPHPADTRAGQDEDHRS
jgi:hypothetical protein